MYCKNCGKLINDDSKNCIYCGCNLIDKKMFTSNSISISSLINEIKTKIIPNFINNLKNNKNFKIKLAIASLTLLVLCCTIINFNSLDKYEKTVYQGCLDLQKHLKDPDSLKLYDHGLVIINNDGDYYSLIQYGAANSFGASIYGEAIFINGKYICEYGEEWEPGKNKDIVDANMVFSLFEYQMLVNGDANQTDYKYIDLSKISKKLNLK